MSNLQSAISPFFSAISIVAVSALLFAGCSSAPGRVSQPGYSRQAGRDAVKEYDANGDGGLGRDEVERAAGLRESFGKIDADNDGSLTATEIDKRIQQWRDSRVAEMIVMCEVTLDGAPLADALITFEPESFLGSNVNPATGTTSVNGTTSVSMAEEHLADPRYAATACGWYKIRVTSSGKSIPPRFNTATTLGCEVANDAHWTLNGVIPLELKSK